MERPLWLDATRELALERCRVHDSAHDGLHLQRVVANARRIIETESRSGQQVNSVVVEAACWLHDLVQLPKGRGRAGESARQSSEVARASLLDHAVAMPEIEAICHAIEAHSFSGGLRPQTIEAAIVQDADRLDALGAVGIARLWVTGVSLGGLLYHPDDPPGRSRDLDDRKYSLDHIERKLLTLPETMNTTSARDEALSRAAFVADYRKAFLRELGFHEAMLDSSK